MNFFFIKVIFFCGMVNSIAMQDSASQLIEIIDLHNESSIQDRNSVQEYFSLSSGKDVLLPIKMMGEEIDQKIVQRAYTVFPEQVKKQIEETPNPSVVQITTAPYYVVRVPICLLIRSHFYRENIDRDPLTAEFFKQLSLRFPDSYYIDKCTRTIKNNIQEQESTVIAVSSFYNKAEIIRLIQEHSLMRIYDH